MSIHLYIGCMFSGKTSRIIDNVKRATIAGLQTLVVTFVDDTRYSDPLREVCTHDKIAYKGRIMSVRDLGDIPMPMINQVQVIAIDEFQFYKSPEVVIQWALAGKDIYLAALDGDYKTDIFENVAFILPKTNTVSKLHAVCMKCRDLQGGIFTSRLSNETERVVIGGSDKYLAVCRKCRY